MDLRVTIAALLCNHSLADILELLADELVRRGDAPMPQATPLRAAARSLSRLADAPVVAEVSGYAVGI